MSRRKEFERAIKKYLRLMGLQNHYKYITLVWCNKDRPIDPDHPENYGGATARPQYGRAALYFDLDHPAWMEEQDEGTIESGVRHECGHLMVGPIVQFAERMIEQLADKQAQEMLKAELNDVEDTVVSWFEHMPAWDALD